MLAWVVRWIVGAGRLLGSAGSSWCCRLRLVLLINDQAALDRIRQPTLEISEAALGSNHPTVATRRNNLGLMLRDLGDLEGARAQYERALVIGEAALGPDHPTMATIQGNLESLLQALQEAPREDPGRGF